MLVAAFENIGIVIAAAFCGVQIGISILSEVLLFPNKSSDSFMARSISSILVWVSDTSFNLPLTSSTSMLRFLPGSELLGSILVRDLVL